MAALFWSQEYYLRFGFVPNQPEVYTWITSQFLHVGFLHLLGNMWALWLFGDNVEAYFGNFFLPFYLLSGVAANGLDAFLNPDSGIPGIGASGANGLRQHQGFYYAQFVSVRLHKWLRL